MPVILALLVLLACSKPAPPEDFGPAPELTLLDQHGSAFRTDQLRGHISVLDFIFTRCPDRCPLLSARLIELSQELPTEAGGSPLQLVSISVDPDYDRPPVLLAYAEATGSPPLPWYLLTGSQDAIDAAAAGFQQGMERAENGGLTPSILHSERFLLIDSNAHVRGFFPAMEESTSLLQAVQGLDDDAP